MAAMNSYYDQMILSASPVELIRLLYQKAISKVREAREHLRENRIEERAAAINVAYRILSELANSIDAESAPDLAQQLMALYSYMQERLLQANMQQVDSPLADVLGVLATLAEAWSGVSDAPAAPHRAANPWAAAEMGNTEYTGVVLTA